MSSTYCAELSTRREHITRGTRNEARIEQPIRSAELLHAIVWPRVLVRCTHVLLTLTKRVMFNTFDLDYYS